MGSPSNEKAATATSRCIRYGLRNPSPSVKYEVMFHEYDRFATAAGVRCLPIRVGARPAPGDQ